TNSDATKSSGRQARDRLTCSIRSSPCETRRSPPRSPPTWTSKNGESICPMGPWPWLSSIASWRERSSSRLKAGRTVHTAPKKGNVQHRKRTDRYTKGPRFLNVATTLQSVTTSPVHLLPPKWTSFSPPPTILDNSSTHQGEPLQKLLGQHPRLRIEHFPAYAPELNPDE